MLKSDSYRTGTSDTSLCECGKGEETIEHFLLHCGIYAEARSDMMDCLKDTGCVSRSKANFTASESPFHPTTTPSAESTIISLKKLYFSTFQIPKECYR